MKHLLILADVCSDFGGNFIKSIKFLAKEIEGHVAFAFPNRAAQTDWIKELQNVYFFDWNFNSLRNLIQNLGGGERWIIYYHYVEAKKLFLVQGVKGRHTLVCQFHCHLSRRIGIRQFVRYLYWKYELRNTVKICVSQAVSEEVKVFSPKNVFTVYNAVDTERLKESGMQNVIRRDFRNILMMGNFYEIKGTDIAVLALQKLNAKGYEAHLYICCDNPNEVMDYLEQYVEIDFLKQYVKCIPTRNDIAAYYKACQVFLSPSRTEAFCCAAVEASYMGDYTVCTKVSGQSELRVPGIVWVSDPNIVGNSTVEELYEKLKIYFDSPDRQNSTEKKLKDQTFIEKNYSLNQWCQQIIQILSFF